jgi:hypothetical protein
MYLLSGYLLNFIVCRLICSHACTFLFAFYNSRACGAGIAKMNYTTLLTPSSLI